eukprot:CAMPEP_0170542420 /NCGR_PEP_ID=MMETSP0211-20121228/1846_1 /TAXON_ID=311385 /ORGANISM="Pseudokeronopsis sp., Strain OXSARD2" /LENGTH=62 /DNA_ID=CAMNT_0010845467 /DNA_START=1926 /DNA_END=2114 /DNA_ORIENTATION=+
MKDEQIICQSAKIQDYELRMKAVQYDFTGLNKKYLGEQEQNLMEKRGLENKIKALESSLISL